MYIIIYHLHNRPVCLEVICRMSVSKVSSFRFVIESLVQIFPHAISFPDSDIG